MHELHLFAGVFLPSRPCVLYMSKAPQKFNDVIDIEDKQAAAVALNSSWLRRRHLDGRARAHRLLGFVQ